MRVIQGILDFILLKYRMYHYSKKQIRSYQEKQLKKLLRFASAKSRFYKNLHKDIDINNIQHFKNIPVINKKILMDNFDDINTHNLLKKELTDFAVNKELRNESLGYYKNKFVIGLSSGTSGNKGIFITPKSITKRLPFVFMARSGLSMNIMPFRILFLLRVFSQGFQDINFPLLSLKYLSVMTPIIKIIEKINADKINILILPPSLLRLILPFSKSICVEIKTIICCAEVLADEDKEKFEKAFNSKVIQIYQTSEATIGSACRYGSLHINEDLVYTELYDSKNAPVETEDGIGEKMIITNLINYSQPLIRYEMNDVVMLGDKCKCGSNFRVIKKIIGRNDDILFFKNNKNIIQHVFPDLFSRWIITTSENIREFIVEQTKDFDLIIHIELIDKLTEQSISAALEKRIINELIKFDITPKMKIIFENIAPPKDRSKFKRFIKKN